MNWRIALLTGAGALAAFLMAPDAVNAQRGIMLPSPFVVHARGGNEFLYEDPGPGIESHSEAPVGHPGTPIINHANLWSPAWLYTLEGISFGQIASVSVDGQGVRTTLVHPSCVAPQKPTGFHTTGPTGCRTLNPNAADAMLADVYVHLKADIGLAPGPRKLTVRLKPSARGARQGSVVYPVQVARTGTAVLTAAAYVKADFHHLPRVPGFDIDRVSRTSLGVGVREGPIDTADLRAGKPLVGTTDPPLLAVPVVELTFFGKGAGSLKFAAPACLGASSQTTINANTLRVRAQFRIPADPSVPNGGLVGRRADLPSASCHWFLYDPVLDPVLIRKPVHEGKRLSNFTLLDARDSTVRIGPSFLTIVGMGDSYAAGEGAPESFNPSTSRATWELEQCHRSTNSTLTQGARKLSEIPGVWVLFRNFACSGATIHQGLIGPYVGVPRPFGQQQLLPLGSQVDQVAKWLDKQDLSEHDALLLSVGGNDVAFGQVVADCISPHIADCRNHPPLQQAVERGEPGSTAVVGFNNLPTAYDILNQRLQAIGPRAVFITEYPDPTRVGGPLNPSAAQLHQLLCNAVETYDDHFAVLPADLFWGDITPSHPFARHLEIGAKIANLQHREVRWILENLIRPLNEAVATAADRHGWNRIAGFVEHAYDHGFCVTERYINTLKDSEEGVQGDVFGAVHPTKAAYHLYGDVVARELALFFGLPERPNLSVIEESNSQEAHRHSLGDTHNPTNLSRLISAERTRFRVQLTPTTRSVNATFEFHRKNRFSGNEIDGVQQIQAARVGGFRSRLEYAVERDLNLCETLDYRWRIQHSGIGGTRTHTTAWRSLTPAPLTRGELNRCPQ